MNKYLICCGKYRKFYSTSAEACEQARKLSNTLGSCRVLEKLPDGKYRHLCQYYSKG